MINLEELFSLNDKRKDRENSLRYLYHHGFTPWFKRFREGDTSLSPNLQGMVENGLTEEEAFLILAYTGSSSGWINSDLREGKILQEPDKVLFAKYLDYVLEKMPSFDSQVVFRMETPSGDAETVLKWFESKLGSTFVLPYYLSTAQEDYENSEIVWKINTLSQGSFGKNISNLSNNKYEKEVLFKRGAKFKIKSTDLEKSYIFLEEVNSFTQEDFPLTGLYHRNIP